MIQVNERPPIAKAIPLSIQHTFAMFGASVLVPLLFGIDAGIVLLMNGFGTFLFIFLTQGKAPAYLGSSFAYLAPAGVVMTTAGMTFRHAQAGFVISGLAFCLIALIIKLCGTKWIDVVLPPAAMGPVVALIGMELATTAAGNSGLMKGVYLNGAVITAYDAKSAAVFFVTLLTAVLGSVLFRKFLGVIPILISIVVGYVMAMIMGLVDFAPVTAAAWFKLPNFQTPIFDFKAIMIIFPATLVVISEHIGHQMVTSKVIGRDLVKDPGLHRSMLGDGLSSAISGFVGSVPTTTYGENIGVMAITRVYSVWVIGGAAVVSICMAFIGKLSALIATIPGPVMSGVSFLLFGMIAASGIRLMVDAKVDFSRSRNLVLTAVVLITGLSQVSIPLGDVPLKGMALATVVGIILSLAFWIFDKLGWTNDSERTADEADGANLSTSGAKLPVADTDGDA